MTIYTTLQHNLPVFVRSRHFPVIWKGKEYKFQKQFPWKELNVPQESVELLFKVDKLYHDESLEKDAKAGDRLVELDKQQLLTLVRLVNDEVKRNTSTKEEFTRYKIKGSTIEDKQRGLIRSWLHAVAKKEEWIAFFYETRDSLLNNNTEE